MIIINRPNNLQGAMTDPTFVLAGLDVQALNSIEVVLNGVKVATKSFRGIETARVNVGGYAIREALPKPPMRGVGVVSLPWALQSLAIRGEGFESEPVKISLAQRKSIPTNQPLTDSGANIALARNSIDLICLAPTTKPSASITLMAIDKEYSFELPNSYTEGMAAVVTDFGAIAQMLRSSGDSIDNYHSAELVVTLNNNTITRRFSFIAQSANTIVWINHYGVWDSFSPLQLTKHLVIGKGGTTTNSYEFSSPLLPSSQVEPLATLDKAPAAWMATNQEFEPIASTESSLEFDHTQGAAPKIKIVKITKTDYRWL